MTAGDERVSEAYLSVLGTADDGLPHGKDEPQPHVGAADDAQLPGRGGTKLRGVEAHQRAVDQRRRPDGCADREAAPVHGEVTSTQGASQSSGRGARLAVDDDHPIGSALLGFPDSEFDAHGLLLTEIPPPASDVAEKLSTH
jgi:hypothetical protein